MKDIVIGLFKDTDIYAENELITKMNSICNKPEKWLNFLINKKIIFVKDNNYILNRDEFQFSVFNFSVVMNDKYSLIKNSRSENIIKCQNSILNVKLISQLDKLNFFHLYKLDFIVPKAYDEISIYVKNAVNWLENSKTMNIMLATTLLCNFKCSYCYENEIERNIEFSIKEVSQNFKKIKEYIKRKKIEKIVFTLYGGEPTLSNIDILREIAIEMVALGIPFVTDIITNGYIMNDSIIEVLSKLNIYNFQVTLDGPQRIHDKLRPLKNGSETFDTIIENVSKVIGYKIAKKIIIRINCSKHNIDSIDELLTFLSNKFENSLHYFVLSLGLLSYGLSKKTNQLIDEISIEEEIEKFCKLYIYARKLGINVTEKYCISNLCMNKSPKCIMIAPNYKYYKCMKSVGHENLNCDFDSIDKTNLDINAFIYCKNKKCPYVPYCYLGCLMDDYMISKEMKINCRYSLINAVNKRLLYELYK